MKKKIFGIFTAVFLFVVTLGLSACGNKYEKMEFNILYAFSEDATEWLDGNNGILCNYGGPNDELVIDEDTVGKIYIKVQLENVKEKYVDDVIVTKTSDSSGLNFNTATVEQGQVFSIELTNIVKTSLKFYETNSGKSQEIDFAVYHSIEDIKVDTSVKPVVTAGDNVGIDLSTIENLTYLPLNATNQTGVNYSIDSVGYYILGANGNTYVQSSTDLNNLSLNGSRLVVGENFVPGANSYIVRIKATSKFNEGIAEFYDVFVVDRVTYQDGSLYAPKVIYDINSRNVDGTFTLYAGDGNYGHADVLVDYSDLPTKNSVQQGTYQQSIYLNGVNTIEGTMRFVSVVYVDNKKVDIDRQEIVNGIKIERLDVNTLPANQAKYRVIATNSGELNRVRFAIELENVYNVGALPNYRKEVQVKKQVLPSSISINGETFVNGDKTTGIIYGSNDNNYKGLNIEPIVYPLLSENKTVIIEGVNNSLNNLEFEPNLALQSGRYYTIESGKSFSVKFKRGVDNEQKIVLKVLSTPTEFLGDMVSAQYVAVEMTLTKRTTADNVETFTDIDCNQQIQNNKLFIDANAGTSFYAKVYYTGTNLDRDTVTFKSSNANIKFNNNSNELSLSDATLIVAGDDKLDGKGKYDIYRVSFMPNQLTGTSSISLNTAIKSNLTVFTAESVYLLEEGTETVSVVGESQNAQKFEDIENESQNFAVVKSRNVDFELTGRVKNSNRRIQEVIKIKREGGLTPKEVTSTNFDINATRYNRVSDNEFSVSGRLGGKTQVLTMKIAYYKMENGVIVEAEKDVQLEFAVYDPIINIRQTPENNNNSIVYVNSFFTEARSTYINFQSYTDNNSMPSTDVAFTNGVGGVITKTGATQVKVQFDKVIDEASNVRVSLVSDDGTEKVLLDGDILSMGEEDLLRGRIKVELLGQTGYSDLRINLTALRFGENSNFGSYQLINFPEYEYVDRVTVSGDEIVSEGVDSNYVYMSFMRVKDGGVAEATFNTAVNYASTHATGSRFGDLTYLLYQVEQNEETGEILLDDNGKIILGAPLTSDLSVQFDDNKATLTASKSTHGGLFKLVILPKDSYNDATETFDESKGATLFVSISDGSEKNRYVINSQDDLQYINYGLNANYVLASDVDARGMTLPLGVVDNIVQPFTGSLVGRTYILNSNGEIVYSATHSITLRVNSSATGTENNAYAGLFAYVGKGGKISDLTINASFDTATIESRDSDGELYVAGLAARNEGSIENVELVIEDSNLKFISDNITTDIAFGGIAGVNHGTIAKVKIRSNEKTSITSSVGTVNAKAKEHNIGLVAGINNGEISGEYQDKELDTINYDVIANLNFTNSARSPMTLNMSAVAGQNNGYIHNLIIGGEIVVNNSGDTGVSSLGATSWLGAVAGISSSVAGTSGKRNVIENCTTLGLNLLANASINVAGIVGASYGTDISHVRVLSANVKFEDGLTTVGKISSKHVAAGIVASMNGEISFASVENFISGAQKDGVVSAHVTIQGKDVYGLANLVGGGKISSSFVNANLQATNSAYVTTNSVEDDTYFVGQVLGGVSANSNATYAVIYDGTDMDIISGGETTTPNLNFFLTETKTISLYKHLDVMKEIVVTEDDYALKVASGLYTFDGTTYTLITSEEYSQAEKYYEIDTILNVDAGILVENADILTLVGDLTEIKNNPNRNYFTLNGDYITKSGNKFTSTESFNKLYIKEGSNYTIATLDAVVNENNFKKLDLYELELNETAWKDYVESVIGVGDTNKWQFAVDEKINKYNAIKIEGLYYYFPYLLDNGEPSMIIRPTDIKVAINQNYIIEIDSIYVDTSITVEPRTFTSSAIINYHNLIGNPLENYKYNEYYNVNAERYDEETKKYVQSGLVDLTVVPSSGGVRFEIVSGSNFAHIVGDKIVFTGVSGRTPIVVRAFSVFNEELEEYVALYTQLGISDIELNSTRISSLDEKIDVKNNGVLEQVDFELSTFTGQNPSLISIEPKNIFKGQEFSTILDSTNAERYLELHADLVSENSILNVQGTNSLDSVQLSVDPKAEFDGNYVYEYVRFSYVLNLKEYFGELPSNLFDGEETIEIAEVYLRVAIYKSATEVKVLGAGSYDIATNANVNLDVDLITGYQTETVSNAEVREFRVSNNQVEFLVNDADTLILEFDVTSGEEQVEKLLQATKTSEDDNRSFADLFDFTAIYSSLKGDNGYNYSIKFNLIDKFEYRYITSPIEFTLKVMALSNNEISATVTFTLNPTELSTARIENYTATGVSTDGYTHLITRSNTETSIISPGGYGGVMLIYLEPSYSNVKLATLTSSKLFVPSLNREVGLVFEQLVYNERTRTYDSLPFGDETVENGIKLRMASKYDINGKLTYNGIIYIHTQMDKFSGLADTVRATLTVETETREDAEVKTKTIVRTKSLLTQYLPGIGLSYNGVLIDAENNEYLIEKNTFNNEISLNVFGYQFNNNPAPSYKWRLDPENKEYRYGSKEVASVSNEEEFKNLLKLGLYTLDGTNYTRLTDSDQFDSNKTYYVDIRDYILKEGDEDIRANRLYVLDYVSGRLQDDYTNLVENTDGSYTIKLLLNVSEDIPASFEVSASLSLATEDSIITSDETLSLVLHPVDYVLTSIDFADLSSNGEINLPINSTRAIDFAFTTTNENVDNSEDIYNKLLEDIGQDNLLNQFTAYLNGTDVPLSLSELGALVARIEGGRLTLRGTDKLSTTINFNLRYSYEKDENGEYVLRFSVPSEDSGEYERNISFRLNVLPNSTEDKAIPIFSREEMFNSNGECILAEGMDYILMNDIEVDNLTPITTKIASLDGNNRIIKINSFAISTQRAEYGLFAEIGTYQVGEVTRQTILKNVMVDYSGFNHNTNGVLSLTNNNLHEVVFGGLVAVNKGGLIYNCDVVNTASNEKRVNILVDNSSDVNVTLGGFVGRNDNESSEFNGIITNSRVGRKNYTKVTATSESPRAPFGSLSFVLGDTTRAENQNFVGVTGGFVGENNGIITSSYIANTSLINYSAALGEATTAGFAGNNNGTISYSYVKADEDTISSVSPYATGATIESRANGEVAGFVHNNSGSITNAYANTELVTTSSYVSGFVYENMSGAKISESYSACTMNITTGASVSEQPFVGIDSANNLLSYGELVNCYYLTRAGQVAETESGKPQAKGLNEEAFVDSNNLNGFVFINSNSRVEREQGVWSYYNNENRATILPELNNANKISTSYRYVAETIDNNGVTQYTYTNPKNYLQGQSNNPYIIRSVDEFNSVMTDANQSASEKTGFFRLINNIDFSSRSTSIATRVNFTLGNANSVTSFEGNGMTIRGIYLDVNNANTAREIGLFANIKNAYVKNLNLEFVSTGSADEQFSSISVQYAGGLAGKIDNSVISNLKLSGATTTIAGRNFAGGLAGVVSGQSMIHGVSTNLSVKAVNSQGHYMYYRESDFAQMRNYNGFVGSFDEYQRQLSYAGALAGVLDLEERKNTSINLSNITIDGETMYDKTSNDGNVTAVFAGGVAGYMSGDTSALRLKFNVGHTNLIKGSYSVGGLFAVALGNITASQVTAKEDEQYSYDTTLGQYVIDLSKDKEKATLASSSAGNLKLIEGYNYVGGLVGLGLHTTLHSVYSKAGIVLNGTTDQTVGGLFGVSYATTTNYSYAVSYITFSEFSSNNNPQTKVGGLIGSAHRVDNASNVATGDVTEYVAMVNNIKKKKGLKTHAAFTFSTLIMDNNLAGEIKSAHNNVVFDYLCAEDLFGGINCLSSNQGETLSNVYIGTINYGVEGVAEMVGDDRGSHADLWQLYEINTQGQLALFSDIFSTWDGTYWSFDDKRYFPLLFSDKVDSYERIEKASDFDNLINRPEGKFKIVNDIDMKDWYDSHKSNFVFNVDFKGILVGEKDDGGGAPTVYGLYVNTVEDNNAGLFRSTEGATLRDIIFEWDGEHEVYNNKSAINIRNEDKIGFVGGVSASDTGSVFTNIVVNVAGDTTSGYNFLNQTTNNGTVYGFGGIVGQGKASTIVNCSFNANVQLQVRGHDNGGDAYIGGLVGDSITRDSTDPNETTVTTITSSTISLNNQKFVVNADSRVTGSLYVGLAVGNADSTTLSNINVGANTNRGRIKFEVNAKAGNSYIGGLLGYSSNSLVRDSKVFADINFAGNKSNAGNSVSSLNYVGGVAGEFYGGVMRTPNISGVGIDATIDVSQLNASVCNVSLGIAHTHGGLWLTQNLFMGDITTKHSVEETGNDTDTSTQRLGTVYAGGVIALLESNSVTIEETMVYVPDRMLIEADNYIYAGAIVGQTKADLTINNCITAGKIVPVCDGKSKGDKNIFVGGLVGETSAEMLIITQTISTTSILSNGIAPNVLLSVKYNNTSADAGKVEIGALVGSAKRKIARDVFYSSDLALAPEVYPDADYECVNLPATALTKTNVVAETDAFKKSTEWMNTEDNLGTTVLLPRLAALGNMLENFGIIGGNGLYLTGTSLNPKVYTSSSTVNNNEYYVVDDNTESLTQPIYNREDAEFNGVFIGRNGQLSTSVQLFGTIGEYGAISNFHITMNSGFAGKSLIANNNKGTIFASSVTGNDVKLEGTGDIKTVGLIAHENYGLISYSFSDIEIINTTKQVAGIVYANNGTVDSCYFTGYIEASADSSVTQIAGISVNSKNGFIFNSYMAGVIKADLSGESSLSVSSFTGANNYIDKWANFETQKGTFVASGLSVTDSIDLMQGGKLKGTWSTIFKSTPETYIDPTSKTFGYNYGYPVHNFNRVSASNFAEDITHLFSRYTGTGANSHDGNSVFDYRKDINNNLQSIDPNVLAQSNSTGALNNVFKIPHLGVLSAVQYLANTYQTTVDSVTGAIDTNLVHTNLNYVLIYDINGGTTVNTDQHKWQAVGGNLSDNDGRQFNGLFVSMKYFNSIESNGISDYSKDKDDNLRCTIANLSNGLFDNVVNAYFANIIFAGDNNRISNSGLLAVKAIENRDSVNLLKIDVVNIKFEERSTINASGDFAGALFGEIAGASVTITNLTTYSTPGDGDNRKVTNHLTISGGEDTNLGFVAGKMTSGTVTFTEGNDTLFVALNGASGGYAGGLFGSYSGGSVIGNGQNIRLVPLGNSANLGGLVGVVENSNQGEEINGLNVILQLDKTDLNSRYNAGSFGGLVAEVQGAVTFNTCTIQVDEQVEFTLNGTSKYFGLIAGIITSSIDVQGFAVTNTKQQGAMANFIVNAQNVSSSTEQGYGVLVGKTENSSVLQLRLASGVDVALITRHSSTTQSQSSNSSNVGGIVGYYEGGQILIAENSTSELGSEVDYKVVVSGENNVGGAIGYASADVSQIAGDETDNSWQFLTSGDNFATVTNDTILATEVSNWGGLIGSSSVELHDLINGNKIEFTITKGSAPATVKNVGGVVGSMNKDATNLLNKGTIVYSTDVAAGGYQQGFDKTKPDVFSFGDTQGANNSQKFMSIKAVNVGGVIGLFGSDEGDGVTASNLTNTAEIEGYQNVGGIVGQLMSNATLESTLDVVNLTPISGDLVPGNAYITAVQDSMLDESGEYPYIISLIIATGKENTKDGNYYRLEDLSNQSKNAPLISHNSSTVKGAINVGGAVGASAGTIDLVWSSNSVYGNANVGGFVGYVYGGTITNSLAGNDVVSSDSFDDEVKGIYLSVTQRKANEGGMGGDDENISYFIPTNVGGFAGTIANSKSSVEDNLANIQVTSTNEGAVGSSGINTSSSVISTYTNLMANVDLKTLAESDDNYKRFANSVYTYSKDNEDFAQTVNFADQVSGFGGFVGSSIIALTNNYLATHIEAQLGVNVGTFYGVYFGGGDLNALTVQDSLVKQSFTPKLLNDVEVSGAYNVGGVAGYITGEGTTDSVKFKNDSINTVGGTKTISVQPKGVGMYVGGLFGRVSGNASGLQINSINSNSESGANIKITTTNSYYIGGLVGKLEGNLEETAGSTDTENKVDGLNIIGTTAENFGGLVGMLKVTATGDNKNVTVNGTHSYEFTINTIENANYYDAESTLDMEESDGTTYLMAQAFYINLDNFTISGSGNTTLYDGVNDYNPLVGKELSFGWSKQYTGFKTIQRCIPQNNNVSGDKKADWDSIAVIYDASFIKHVGTIRNLGLMETDLQCEEGTKTGKQFIYDYINQGKSDSAKREITDQDDYVCYTIYEETEGDPTLYCPIGIATVVYKDEGDGYKTVTTDTLSDSMKAIYALMGEDAPETKYIDATDPNNNLCGLTYFKWGDSEGWTEYTYVQNGRPSTDKTTYKKGRGNSSGGTGGENRESLKSITYFVSGYHYPDGEDKNNNSLLAKYTNNGSTRTGAYFVFDTVFDNQSTIDILTNQADYAISSNSTYIPKSGSLFDVCGYSSSAGVKIQQTAEGGWSTSKIINFVGSLIVEALIIAASFGTSTAVIGGVKVGIKEAFKSGFKGFMKYAGKKVVGMFAKKSASKAFLKWGTIAVVGVYFLQSNASTAQSTSKISLLERKDQDFGIISQSYNRSINMSGGKVKAQSDEIIYDEDYMFTYYSSYRPSDYYTEHYVGIKIGGDISNPIEFKKFPYGTTYTVVNDEFLSNSDNKSLFNDCVEANEWIVESGDWLVRDNETTYLLLQKYIYKNGSYYMNIFSSDFTTVPVQFGFVAPKDSTGEIIENASILDNGYNYVYGYYNDGKYSLGSEIDSATNRTKSAYKLNKLTYDESKKKYYGLSGSEIDTDEFSVVVKDEKVKFVYRVNFETSGWIEGYDYIQGAYYIPVDKSENIDSELVRYATYRKVEESEINGLNLGSDYITYTVPAYSYYETDVDGNQIIKTEQPQTLYYKIISVELSGDSRYQNKSDWTPYTFASIPNSNGIYASKPTLNTENYLYINIYPTQFVNPYKLEVSNVKDKKYYVNSTDEGYSIGQDIEYFYFDGGYMTDKDKTKIYLPIQDATLQGQDDKPVQYYDIAKITIFENSSDTEGTTLTFSELATGLTQHGNWYVEKPSADDAGVKVEDTYQSDGETLYLISSHVIDNGLPAQVVMDSYKASNNFVGYNFQKYLTNGGRDLYTRYKFVNKNGQVLDLSAEWTKLEYDFDKDALKITNDKGEWTGKYDYDGTHLWEAKGAGKYLFNGGNIQLVERVKVVLGGGQALRKLSSDADNSTKKAGTIKIT